MLPVSIFPVHILGEDHHRVVLPIHPHQGQEHLLVAELALALLGGVPGDVREPQEEGPIPEPQLPIRVDGLPHAVAGHAGHVGDAAHIPLLRPVDGHHGAHVEHIVVRVGGDEQIIQMIRGLLPEMEGVGQLPGAEHAQAGDLHPLLPRLDDDGPDLVPNGQDRVRNGGGPLLPAQFAGLIEEADGHSLRHLKPFQAQPAGVHVLPPGHGDGPFRRKILMHHHVVAQQAIQVRPRVARGLDGALLRQLPGPGQAVRQGRPRQQEQDERQRQAQAPAKARLHMNGSIGSRHSLLPCPARGKAAAHLVLSSSAENVNLRRVWREQKGA